MKKKRTILSVFLSILSLLTLVTAYAPAYAANLSDAVIDHTKQGSLTIYKYDTTTAQKNGLKDGVYLSTGKENPEAAAAYAPYAIPGVEFTILRVGDIDTYTVSNGASNTTQVIYGISDSGLISALGLTQNDRVTVKNNINYYSSDTLINALAGNPNNVTLTWSRTTDGYYDTLTDQAKVYVFGIELTKVLSEGGTAYQDVKFVIQNSTNVTGSYYLEASKSADGVYYITGETDKEADATRFIPNDEGKLLVYGLGEDTYIITEVETAAGYTLLKDSITVEITTAYTPGDKCGALSAAATVDKNLVTMEKAGNSDNALVPLTVLNTKGFDLPKTGGPGTLATTICGFLVVGAMAALAFFTRKRKHG